jgi:precorrin-2 methylase
VCAEIEAGPDAWRALDLAIVPGITAMLAAAARAGAPLGHDFCALSLSDNLKPWELIERRLAMREATEPPRGNTTLTLLVTNQKVGRLDHWAFGKTMKQRHEISPAM